MNSFDTDSRALVVEDECRPSGVLSVALKSRDHEVTVCADAESGWAEFLALPSPLVVLDGFLPHLQGGDQCRRIRAHPNGKYCVILMSTLRKAPADLEAILESGADDYIILPASADNLRLRLAAKDRLISRTFSHQCATDQNIPASVACETSIQRIRRLNNRADGAI